MTTPRLTTETLLCHPKAFGLTTATPVQRAWCRALDGLPLGKLADDEDVHEAVGDVSALPVGEAPFEALGLMAIRCAKTLGAAAKIVQLSQSVDVDQVGRGDIIRICVAALKLDGTAPLMSHLVENIQAKPLLKPLLVGEASLSGVTLRHPSGRLVEVTPIPIDRAGGSALSVWNAGLVIDEAPRMVGAADGVKNWDDTRRAVLGRILPGGQFLSIGSPWAPFGPIYDLVTERWGKPSGDLVIFRVRGAQGNPSWWTPQRLAALRRRDTTAWRTDAMCEFADAEESLIAPSEYDACTRAQPMELPYEKGGRYFAAMDPATRGNSWALVIVRTEMREGRPWHRVACVRQWTGTRGSPLSPRATLEEAAAILRGYHIGEAATDQWSSDALVDLAQDVGLKLRVHTTSAASSFEMFDNLRTSIATCGIEFPPNAVLRGDVLSLRRRVTQAGVSIEAAKSRDGRHADAGTALALCLHIARVKREPVPMQACVRDQFVGVPRLADLDHRSAGYDHIR